VAGEPPVSIAFCGDFFVARFTGAARFTTFDVVSTTSAAAFFADCTVCLAVRRGVVGVALVVLAFAAFLGVVVLALAMAEVTKEDAGRFAACDICLTHDVEVCCSVYINKGIAMCNFAMECGFPDRALPGIHSHAGAHD
jgi:hypothetical protein